MSGAPAAPRSIAVLIACHNRRDRTLTALRALAAQRLPPAVTLATILVDDGSSDGTSTAIARDFPAVRVVPGDGGLFWNGAMTLAQRTAMAGDFAFHLWLNDDVTLSATALAALIAIHDDEIAAGRPAPIVIGQTVDGASGRVNYGGQIHRPGPHPFRFLRVDGADGRPTPCDIFNGNCVLVPRAAFAVLGTIDPAFAGGQPLGDTDYALRARRAGIPALLAPLPVGTCPDNPATTPWQDHCLSLRQRLATLAGPLGPARRQTVHFYRRHGGPAWALWWLIHLARCLARAMAPPPVEEPRPGADKPRLAMIEPVLPWYRLGLLTRLRDNDRVTARTFHGTAHPQGEPSSPPPAGVDHLLSTSLHYPFGPPRVLWTCHVWAVLRGGYDVVMMAEHVFTLSNWVIWAVSRLRGRPRIVLTGHFALERKSGRALAALRLAWLRGADMLAPYTPSGARHCQAIGIAPGRIAVLFNTLDVEEIRRTVAQGLPLPAEQSARLGLAGRHVFLFIGRLYPAKLAPLAAQAVALLAAQGLPASLLVVGDGADRATLERMQAEGAPLCLVGACRDPLHLAGYFALAQALILPDCAGLAINQAFAHGVPVVLGPGRHHGVEVEYAQDGVNALVAPALTAPALAQCLRRMITEPELAHRLRQGASASADQLGMDAYARRIEALTMRAAHG